MSNNNYNNNYAARLCAECLTFVTQKLDWNRKHNNYDLEAMK